MAKHNDSQRRGGKRNMETGEQWKKHTDLGRQMDS